MQDARHLITINEKYFRVHLPSQLDDEYRTSDTLLSYQTKRRHRGADQSSSYLSSVFIPRRLFRSTPPPKLHTHAPDCHTSSPQCVCVPKALREPISDSGVRLRTMKLFRPEADASKEALAMIQCRCENTYHNSFLGLLRCTTLTKATLCVTCNKLWITSHLRIRFHWWHRALLDRIRAIHRICWRGSLKKVTVRGSFSRIYPSLLPDPMWRIQSHIASVDKTVTELPVGVKTVTFMAHLVGEKAKRVNRNEASALCSASF